MTSELLMFFVKYTKYEKQEYFIDNLKTVFEYLRKDESEYIKHLNKENEGLFDFLHSDENNDEAQELDFLYKTIDLNTKKIISEENDTVEEIIDIFNYFNKNKIVFNSQYISKFKKYIMYVLEEKRNQINHKENQYIKYKQYKNYIDLYDMSYNINNSLFNEYINKINNKLDTMINDKINNKISELINKNPNVITDIVYGLNEQAKDKLVNSIVEYHDGELINSICKKTENSEELKNIKINITQEQEQKMDNSFQNKLNNFMSSKDREKDYERGINEFINSGSYFTVGSRIYKYALNLNEPNIRNIKERIDMLTKKCDRLNMGINNKVKEEVDGAKHLGEAKEEVKEEKISKVEIVKVSHQNNNNNLDECFKPHGRKFNLNLSQLMKHSNYTNVKDFKQQLISNNIIKPDYKLYGTTYTLDQEQKTQFIKDFLSFTGKGSKN